MTTTEKPQLDPHPLSPYVAWAGHRNREPIRDLLSKKLPRSGGSVLEFASGSGMHINFFAPNFSHLTFQPSDRTDETFENIRGVRDQQANSNVSDPIVLDLTAEETWPGDGRTFDAIYCINIFQVAPVSIADGMMACSSRVLAEDGFLMVYGPFIVDGRFTTPSNAEFHDTLRSYGVDEWGLKDVADLRAAAKANGLVLKEVIDMPANNFALVFARE